MDCPAFSCVGCNTKRNSRVSQKMGCTSRAKETKCTVWWPLRNQLRRCRASIIYSVSDTMKSDKKGVKKLSVPPLWTPFCGQCQATNEEESAWCFVLISAKPQECAQSCGEVIVFAGPLVLFSQCEVLGSTGLLHVLCLCCDALVFPDLLVCVCPNNAVSLR